MKNTWVFRQKHYVSDKFVKSPLDCSSVANINWLVAAKFAASHSTLSHYIFYTLSHKFFVNKQMGVKGHLDTHLDNFTTKLQILYKSNQTIKILGTNIQH